MDREQAISQIKASLKRIQELAQEDHQQLVDVSREYHILKRKFDALTIENEDLTTGRNCYKAQRDKLIEAGMELSNNVVAEGYDQRKGTTYSIAGKELERLRIALDEARKDG